MNENSLSHHGVKGMKWGVRKDRRAKAAPYKSAVKDARRKEKSSWKAVIQAAPVSSALALQGLAPYRHSEAGKRYNKAVNEYVNARQKRIEAQVEYAKSKASDPRSAAKAERKAYSRAFKEVGLPGSAKDTSMGNAGKKLYNSIKQTKGKAYADSLESKVTKDLYTSIAVSSVVAVGAYATSAYLINR